jgi:hypothetical protein
MARARAVQEDHEAGASRLVVAFEELSSTVERTSRSLGDLAADLDAALRALGAAVERWVDEDGPAVARTAVELGDVAGLTTVIAELVGVAALHRPPDEGAGVKAVAGRAPGAHRLVKALHRQWLDVAPEQLREASFAADHRATGLAESIAGRLAGDEPGGEGGVSRVAAR